MTVYIRVEGMFMGAQHSNNFFKASQQTASQQTTSQQPEKYEVINVGGEQFHAAAVALIDSLRCHAPISVGAVKRLVDNFSKYFPQSFLNVEDSLTPPKENLGRLLRIRTPELVERMAYVLRQMAIDEVYANYLELTYRPIFSAVAGQIPTPDLRDPNTSLPSCVLTALDKVLGVPITLSFKETDKCLRKQETSMHEQHDGGFTIQVQGNLYHPVVRRKEDYGQIGRLTIAINPEQQPAEPNRTMADMFTGIDKQNQQDDQEYKRQLHRILMMYTNRELPYEDLRNFFIALYPMRGNDTAVFIRQLANSNTLVQDAPSASSEQKAVDLAKALASWIAADLIQEEQLFQRIDNLPTPSR